MNAPPSKIVSRQIEAPDIPAVVDLLRAGFPERPGRYWADALEALRVREAPAGYPRFGYLLQHGETVVGVILLIFSTFGEGGEGQLRCNVSSWYVTPAYRGYATLLTSAALRFKEATYLNISPHRDTWPILDAQGYRRYSNGQMACLPALTPRSHGAKVSRFDPARPSPLLESETVELLREHAARGCLVLVCDTGAQVLPFIFVRRRLKHLAHGTAQLVYCPDTTDFVRFAGPIGRRLLRHGVGAVLLDAEGPVPGLVGRFFNNRMPKYFKGARRPRLNDLTHTEAVLFGV